MSQLLRAILSFEAGRSRESGTRLVRHPSGRRGPLPVPRRPPLDSPRSAPSPEADRLPRSANLLTGALLFAFLYLAALLVYSGSFKAIDEAILFGMTRSLVTQGSLAVDAFHWANRPEIVVLGETGPDGHLYSYFEPAQSVLAAPLYWIAAQWQGGGLIEAVLLLNPLVFAALGWVLWQLGLALGYARPVALTGALLICLATPLWAYSKTFFREPLAALGLLLAVYCLVRLRRGHWLWAGLAGLAFGGGLLARTSNLLAAPGLGILLLAALVAVPSWSSRAGRLAACSAGGAIGVACLLAYTGLRFGDPLYSPYQPQHFGSSLGTGLWGLLVSPGKGIFVYAPLLLLALAGFPRFARRHPALAGAVALTGAAFVLFFARYLFWWGGLAWGPRFLIAVLPLLALPVWTVLDWAWPAQRSASDSRAIARLIGWLRSGRAWLVAAVATIAGLSLLTQIEAVAVRYGDYLYWLGQQTGDQQPETGVLLTDWAASPVLAQWSWLTADHSDLLWWRSTAGSASFVEWGLLLVLLTAFALGAGLLIWAVRRPPRLSPGQLAGSSAIGLLVLLGVTALTLTTARGALAQPDLAQAARRVAEQATPADRVVTVLGHRTAGFLNELAAPLPVTGLPLTGYPPDPSTAEPLERLTERAERIWLIADQVDDADPRNGVGRWLAEHAYPISRTSWQGVQVGLFAVAPRQGLTQALPPSVSPAEPGEASTEAQAGGPASPGWSPIFADKLRLDGAWVSASPVRAGETVALRTDWMVLDELSVRYSIAAALIDATGRVYATTNHEPRDGFARLTGAAPGRQVSDGLGLPVPTDAPPGLYYVAIGVYDPASDRRLPISDDASTEVRVGPIHIVPAQPEPPRLAPDERLGARLGDRIELVGARLAEHAVAPGGTIRVTLYWRADRPVETDYTVFVHLGPAGAPPLAQSDGPPAEGRYPTSFWPPGAVIKDERLITVPATIPPGSYDLRAGLYHARDGRRLPAHLDGRTESAAPSAQADAVSLGQIRVTEGG